MNRIILASILALAPTCLLALDVTGDITTTRTWTSTDSPVLLKAPAGTDINVNAGATLTIDASGGNVDVSFEGVPTDLDFNFIVGTGSSGTLKIISAGSGVVTFKVRNGCNIVVGSQGQLLFTGSTATTRFQKHASASGNWGALIFEASQTRQSEVKNCSFSDCGTDTVANDGQDGALRIKSSTSNLPTLASLTFSNCTLAAIRLDGNGVNVLADGNLTLPFSISGTMPFILNLQTTTSTAATIRFPDVSIPTPDTPRARFTGTQTIGSTSVVSNWRFEDNWELEANGTAAVRVIRGSIWGTNESRPIFRSTVGSTSKTAWTGIEITTDAQPNNYGDVGPFAFVDVRNASIGFNINKGTTYIPDTSGPTMWRFTGLSAKICTTGIYVRTKFNTTSPFAGYTTVIDAADVGGESTADECGTCVKVDYGRVVVQDSYIRGATADNVIAGSATAQPNEVRLLRCRLTDSAATNSVNCANCAAQGTVVIDRTSIYSATTGLRFTQTSGTSSRFLTVRNSAITGLTTCVLLNATTASVCTVLFEDSTVGGTSTGTTQHGIQCTAMNSSSTFTARRCNVMNNRDIGVDVPVGTSNTNNYTFDECAFLFNGDGGSQEGAIRDLRTSSSKAILTHCTFQGNKPFAAFDNGATGVMQATTCYWNSASGPTVSSSPPVGAADYVNSATNVNFASFLVRPWFDYLLGGNPAGATVWDVKESSSLDADNLHVVTTTPYFAWTFGSDFFSETQSAYQVQVATTTGFETANTKWDSGKVASTSATGATYAGTTLSPGTTYYARVQLYNQSDRRGPWRLLVFRLDAIPAAISDTNRLPATGTNPYGDATPVFTFDRPADSDGDPLHFKIDIDSVSGFGSGAMRSFDTRTLRNGASAEYSTDGELTWLPIPADGCPAPGATPGQPNIRIRINAPYVYPNGLGTLTTGTTWYWRVTTTDGFANSTFSSTFNFVLARKYTFSGVLTGYASLPTILVARNGTLLTTTPGTATFPAYAVSVTDDLLRGDSLVLFVSGQAVKAARVTDFTGNDMAGQDLSGSKVFIQPATPAVANNTWFSPDQTTDAGIPWTQSSGSVVFQSGISGAGKGVVVSGPWDVTGTTSTTASTIEFRVTSSGKVRVVSVLSLYHLDNDGIFEADAGAAVSFVHSSASSFSTSGMFLLYGATLTLGKTFAQDLLVDGGVLECRTATINTGSGLNCSVIVDTAVSSQPATLSCTGTSFSRVRVVVETDGIVACFNDNSFNTAVSGSHIYWKSTDVRSETTFRRIQFNVGLTSGSAPYNVQATSSALLLNMLQCGGIGNGEQFDGDASGDARVSFGYMPPTGLKAIAGNSVNRIEWASDPQASTPSAGFRVFRETNPNVAPPWTLISGASPITTGYYNDATAVNGTLYYYYVTVMDGPSGSESGGSARVSAKPAAPAITMTSPGSAFSTGVVAMTVVGSVTHFQNAASMSVTFSPSGGSATMNDYFALSPTLLLADLTLSSATGIGTFTLTNTNVFPSPGYTEQVTHTIPINPNNNLNRPTISFNNPTPDFNTPASAPLDFTIQLAYSANSGDPISTATLELMASRAVTVQSTARNPGTNLSAIANFWDSAPSSTLATCTVNQTNPTENFSDGEYILSARIANSSGLYSEWITRRFYVRGAAANVAKIADSGGVPVNLLQGTTMNVTVTGTGLATSPLPNFGADVTVNSATGGGTSITVNLTVGHLAACGPRTFTTNSGSITGVANVAYPTDLLPTVTNAEPPRNPAIGAINVLLVNGAFFKSETDIATRGRMMGISWSRNYRSDISYNGPLGFNWIGFYYQRAMFWSGAQDHVDWFTADGRMETFSGAPGDFMTGPNGVYAVASRDSTHLTITIKDRHGFTCLFNAQGRLQSCTDRNGNKTACTYNFAGQLTRITDDRGFYYDLTYYSHGRVQKVEDKVWNVSTPRAIDYTYDSNGNLTEQKSPTTSRYGGAGAPFTRITYGYRYNAAHQLTACVNPREFAQGSNPTTYMEIVYEGARVVAQRYGAPDQWFYIRYPAGGPVRVIDRRGIRTDYTVDGSGHATTVVRYTGFFSVSTEEPLDHTIVNSAGTAVRAGTTYPDPASYSTSYGYNANHEVISVTYPRTNRTDYTYPNPTFQTSGTATGVSDHTLTDSGASWTPGAFSGMFLQMGFGSGTRYYAITGNTATSIDIQLPFSLLADGWTAGSGYQVYTNNPDPLAKGNLLQVDRVDTILSAANITTRYTYEPRFQFVKTVTNPRNYVTTYFYDYEDTASYGDQGAGNLIRVESPPISLGQSSPQTIVTRTTYNEYGQPVSQIDPVGNATLFLYYSSGANNGFLYQRISSYGDLNLTSQFEYDQVGNLTRSWPARAFEPGATMNDYMTENVVNELNQTWKSTGPKLQQSGTIDDRMSVFRYFDFNGNLTNVFREYVTEGGTEPAVPSDLITPGTFAKASSDMTATWVESKTVYNLLNLPTSRISEFLNGSTIKQLTSLTFYDKSDNVIRSQTPLGNCSATVYDEREMVFQSVSGEFSDVRAVTESDYDPNGNLIRSRDALGNQSTSSYDGFDRGISGIDPAGNERTTIYDANSNAVTSRSFEGAASQNVKLTESNSFFDEVDRAFMTQRMAKDHLGNDIGDGWVTNTTRFDPNGRVTWSMDDNGVYSYSFYDGANRTQRTHDNLGNEVEYEYNLDGAVTRTIYREINGLTNVLEVSHTDAIYDLQNRRLKFRDQRYSATDPLKNTEVQWKYDGWGRVTTSTDAAGITTEQTYDWLSRALRNSRKLVLGTPSTWIVTDNAYDDDSRVSKRTIWEDPGTYSNAQDTRYLYDERSRLTTLQRADGDIFSMTYDANSNVLTTTDPVLTRVNNTYDNRNLIVSRYIERGSGIKGTTFESYAFDGEGRLTSCSNFGDSGLISSSAWDYNTLGWPERQTQTVNTVLRGLRTYTVLSEFDATGFRTRISTTMPVMVGDDQDWPEETRTFVNYPDQLNRLDMTVALSNSQYGGIPVAGYDYAGSRLIRRTYGCNAQTDYTYEASGCGCGGFSAFIERIQHKNLNNNEVIFGVDRRYDKLGNVTVERRDHEAGKGSVFRYDNAYRLTSSYFSVDLTGTGLTTYADPVATPTTFGFKRAFNLDSRGNRTGSSGMSEVTDGGATLHNTNYTVSDPANGNGSNMNLYGSVDGLNYTYDATEQMTFDPSTGLNYEYDYKGQIVRKYGTGGTFATYKYDCQGRLVVQTDDQIFAAEAEDRAAETVTINDIPAGCSCSGGGGDSKLGEENFTNDPVAPPPDYRPIVSRAFYCPVLGAHGSGSSGAVHPLTAASPSSAPGQGSTFPGFQSLICYEGLHDRFLLEDQLGSIIGELDEQCHRRHEYVYLDYGQPISRPIVYDSAGYTPSVSGPNAVGETTISVSGLPGIDLEGMEVRVADGTGNYASATIMIRSGNNLTVWDTASPTVASLISSSRSFVIYSCATSWLDGTWEAVDTGTSKLTENDRDLTTIDGSGSIVGYKLIANSGNGTVFTVTGHDPADPAHKIFVTPSISGIVAAGDHYHLQKWKPISGPPVIATQGGYFTGISGGTNTTFTVFASGAGGAISNFRPWQVGYYLQPNTKKPSYHKILSVTGNTVTVEGNCAALASTGNANHFRVVAPPCVNGFQGGRVYDPVCEESRYLWAGYRYEWPIVGHRIINTSQPDYNQPGPDGSQTTWDGNALGQYHCWNREYDILMGRWTGPDALQMPVFNLQDYASNQPALAVDPTGLFTLMLLGAGQDGANGVYKGLFEMSVPGEMGNDFVTDSWRRLGRGTFGSSYDAVSGAGNRDWKRWAYLAAKEICSVRKANPSEAIRILSYSRGAALALLVAKMLNSCGCSNDDGGTPRWDKDGADDTEITCTPNCPKDFEVDIKFMALVDPVSTVFSHLIKGHSPIVPIDVATNVKKAVIYRATAWTASERAAMDKHVVHTELNRVVERKYWKRHLGTGIDDARVKPNNGPAGPTPGSIYSVAAIDVYKDLRKDYLDN